LIANFARVGFKPLLIVLEQRLTEE
jgi:hypothetical protein